jgi:HK97 family phage portal protein
MGLLSRLFGGSEARSLNSAEPLGVALDRLSLADDGGASPRGAEALTAVFASVAAISSSLASCPILVQRLDDTGLTDLPNHPAARVLRSPNPTQTGFEFIEWLVAGTLLHGNAMAVVEHDGAGRVTGLRPVPWPMVSVVELRPGALAYDVTERDGRRRRYLADEVLHVRDRSDDGLLGRPRLSRAGPAIQNALMLQRWTSAIWGNNASPSGALAFDAALNQTQFDRLRERVRQRYQGAENAGTVMILENGAKWLPFSSNPVDAEVLASRRFAVEEVARLFGVPGPIISDLQFGTFTNSETMLRHFASSTLTWWARRIEACLERSIVAAGDVRITLDLSGLLRGSHTERWATNIAAVQAGILTADEVRLLEGWGPRAAAPAAAP